MIDWRTTQLRLGISADGVAGPNTWRALLRRVAVFAGATPDQGVINSLATAAIVHLPAYGITNTVDRLADFLAQTANETGGYAVFEENLRYSAAGLIKTWPSRFTQASAPSYVGKPELIANRAYGDRMGNTLLGDGYLFRGRGMLQLTGRGNYTATDSRLGIGLVEHPELAAIPALSLLIACEFYVRNKVLAAIDAKNFTKARKITNGGRIGLEEVAMRRARLLTVLAA